ncbi:MAG: prepilin-type N-terminal cleavage/methylation domain-containing protein [Anaeromyxobacter sp.]|nr:prepilin-type N-terminal cleavage/methylation domain-containing protein [Anaeromyxobacter sp.]MBL0275748.1 prepilin-type N-terminal cleavage/methylation domain-containing protein [Anaeromyxobacter sp.]
MRRDRRARGFTLIEMMVVVALIGILAALAYAGFAGQKRRQRLTGTTVEFQALLFGARQTALANGTQVVLMVFPDHVNTLGGTGRFVLYEDADLDFFSAAAGVNFGGFDPAAPAGAGPRGVVLETYDLPDGLVVGPPSGLGVAAVMPAPFAGIAVNVDCSFCTGAGRRGAIAFQPLGTASFHDDNGPPLDLPFGGSFSFYAADADEVRTLAVAASTGVVQTLTRKLLAP